MGYDRGDSFPFDFEPNGIPFGSKSIGKLSPRSYPIQCERNRKYSFLGVGTKQERALQYGVAVSTQPSLICVEIYTFLCRMYTCVSTETCTVIKKDIDLYVVVVEFALVFIYLTTYRRCRRHEVHNLK